MKNKNNNKTINTREKMFEGNEKIFYYHENDYALIEHFKDTSYKSDGTIIEIAGKGVLKNSISSFLMEKLDLIGIDHHFIEKINMREQMIQMTDILPFRTTVSYLASGRYIKEFGMESGTVFDKPMIDFQYKSNNKYITVNEFQLMHLCYLKQHFMDNVKKFSFQIADFLSGFFAGAGIRLVDITLSLGTVFDGSELLLILADEISPDTCRLWDLETNKKLDFEHMQKHPEDTITIYQEILKKIGYKEF